MVGPPRVPQPTQELPLRHCNRSPSTRQPLSQRQPVPLCPKAQLQPLRGEVPAWLPTVSGIAVWQKTRRQPMWQPTLLGSHSHEASGTGLRSHSSGQAAGSLAIGVSTPSYSSGLPARFRVAEKMPPLPDLRILMKPTVPPTIARQSRNPTIRPAIKQNPAALSVGTSGRGNSQLRANTSNHSRA